MSLFSTFGTLASTAMNNAAASEAAYNNNRTQVQLARMQNEYNVDMWKMNNEYNTPANQVQRLVDAGLSPNLAYGSVSTGNSASPPQKVTPQLTVAQRHYDNFLKDFNVLGDYLQIATLGEKVKQEKLKTEGMRAGLDNTVQRTENMAASLEKILLDTSSSYHTANLKEIQEMRAFAELVAMNMVGNGFSDFHSYPHGIDDWKGLYNSMKGQGLTQFYAQQYNNALLRAGLSNDILSENRVGLRRRNSLLKLQNDFFKLEKYFNYFDRGLTQVWKGIDSFSKKPKIELSRPRRFGFDRLGFGEGLNHDRSSYEVPDNDWDYVDSWFDY